MISKTLFVILTVPPMADACLFAVVSRTWRLEPPKAGSHYSTSGSAGTSGSTRRSRNLQARHSRLAPKLGRFEMNGKAPLQHDKLFCHNSGWRNHQQRVLNWFLQGKGCVHIVLYTDCIYMIMRRPSNLPVSQCSPAAIRTKTNVFALIWHRTFENSMICSPLIRPRCKTTLDLPFLTYMSSIVFLYVANCIDVFLNLLVSSISLFVHQCVSLLIST